MAKTLKQKAENQILYICIGCALAILILFITLFTALNRIGKNKNAKIIENADNSQSILEQANSQIGKSIEEVENNNEEGISIQVQNEDSLNEQIESEGIAEDLDKKPEVIEATNNENSEITQATPTIENETIQEDVPDPTFVMPVEGEIVKQYGKEKLIYSNTLKEWTTHLGIDIKADKTTIVKSSSEGTIKSIKNDPRYGLTIVIEHANGFSTIYSNLLTAEFVTVGEIVKSGQTIGTVGNTATFEIIDEPHLHFEILKDGNNIDPEMYIK